MHCSLFLLLGAVENPGHFVYNKHKKVLEGGEKADWLGTLGQKEDTTVSSLGFFSYSLIPLPENWRNSKPKMLVGTHHHQKDPASFLQPEALEGAAELTCGCGHRGCSRPAIPPRTSSRMPTSRLSSQSLSERWLL